MGTLTFTPHSTIDANLFQYRLDNSNFKATWNPLTGAYEFIINHNNCEQLQEEITLYLSYDLDGFFQIIKN